MGKKAGGGITRQTVLKPLGLMSTPNPYGVYPVGALSDATNAVMRRPGVVSAAPAGTNYTTFLSSIYNVWQIAPLDSGHMMLLSQSNVDNWSIDEVTVGGTVNAGAVPPGGVSISGLFSAARATWTRSRDRVLFNTKSSGVFAQDFMAPSSLAERTLRRSGLPQARIGLQSTNTTTGSTIPQNIMVGYRAGFAREYADGYILKSTPSVPIKFLATAAGPTTLTLFVSWPFNLVAGDYVELYRTDGLSTTSLNTDPGGTFKLVYRVKLTATDITNQFIQIVDNQVLLTPFYTTYGRELYTNPYQEGETAGNRQADICNAMTTFKGFTFYGNIVERAQPELSAPGGFNDNTLMLSGNPRRATGVGDRTMTATVTNGSPNVTGISAAEMIGIVPGQAVRTAIGSFPGNTRVVSVGATSFVASNNATSSTSAAGGTGVTDVLEIDGFELLVQGGQVFVQNLQAQSGKEVTINQSVSINIGADSAGLIVTVEPPFPSSTQTITLRATNGQNYSPPLPLIAATVQTFSSTPRTNLLRWSKDSEPEHVPSINETFVGSGQIIALCQTKDALWIACSDGIYRLSGDAGQWRIDTVAPGCVLCAPKCMVNLRDQVFAYTNFGFGAVTDSGFVPISDKILRTELPGSPFAEDAGMLMGFNPVEGEVYVRKFQTDYLWVYNTTSHAFTRISDVARHLQYITAIAWQDTPVVPNAGAVVFGLGEPATAPAFIQWNATATKLDLVVAYHPFFGEDPFSNKQWIDLNYMFSGPGAGYLLVPSVGLESFASSVPLVALQGGSESGATVGVPRKFALAPKIRPGLSVSNGLTNAVDFLGVSVRYVPLTLQSGARK